MDNPAETVVDLRMLPAPQPLERIMDALLGDPYNAHVWLVPHEPRPLIAMLKRMGTPYAGRPVEGGWEIVVGRDRF